MIEDEGIYFSAEHLQRNAIKLRLLLIYMYHEKMYIMQFTRISKNPSNLIESLNLQPCFFLTDLS